MRPSNRRLIPRCQQVLSSKGSNLDITTTHCGHHIVDPEIVLFAAGITLDHRIKLIEIHHQTPIAIDVVRPRKEVLREHPLVGTTGRNRLRSIPVRDIYIVVIASDLVTAQIQTIAPRRTRHRSRPTHILHNNPHLLASTQVDTAQHLRRTLNRHHHQIRECAFNDGWTCSCSCVVILVDTLSDLHSGVCLDDKIPVTEHAIRDFD